MLSCHALHLFRSCRSSRLQRFTPRIALQVYCTLQPIMGFAMFQNPGFACRCPNNSDPKALPCQLPLELSLPKERHSRGIDHPVPEDTADRTTLPVPVRPKTHLH
jgi:hypothetical protein